MRELADISFFNSLAPVSTFNYVDPEYDKYIPGVISDVERARDFLKKNHGSYDSSAFSSDYDRIMNSPEARDAFPGFHKSIGGSTIASIMGISPYDDPTSTWAKMTGLRKPGKPSRDMALGHLFEGDVADDYAKRNPHLNIVHSNPLTGKTLFFRHPEYPIITGQPDRMIFDKDTGKLISGLEIKTTGDDGLRKGGKNKPIPSNYALQSLLYAYLADPDSDKKPDWRFINWALDKKNPNPETGVVSPLYRESYIVPFDNDAKSLIEEAIDKGNYFYDKYIKTNTPPNHEDFIHLDPKQRYKKKFEDWCAGNIKEDTTEASSLVGVPGHSASEYVME